MLLIGASVNSISLTADIRGCVDKINIPPGESGNLERSILYACKLSKQHGPFVVFHLKIILAEFWTSAYDLIDQKNTIHSIFIQNGKVIMKNKQPPSPPLGLSDSTLFKLFF